MVIIKFLWIQKLCQNYYCTVWIIWIPTYDIWYSPHCPAGQSMLSVHVMHPSNSPKLCIECGTFASHYSALHIGLSGWEHTELFVRWIFSIYDSCFYYQWMILLFKFATVFSDFQIRCLKKNTERVSVFLVNLKWIGTYHSNVETIALASCFLLHSIQIIVLTFKDSMEYCSKLFMWDHRETYDVRV